MKTVKDNFSGHATDYARFRPGYPAALFETLATLAPNHGNAWDCGTGNGQVAIALASYFEKVVATDISAQQLANASPHQRVHYSVERAEQTGFADNSFALVTVAQAIHWFDFEKFYAEVNRTSQPGGILAVIGYCLTRIEPAIDALIDHFYQKVVGPFWDPERKYLDENYQTIPFPFEEIPVTPPANDYQWSLANFTGYLNTWSAVQHYIRANQQDPMELLLPELEKLWPGKTTKTVRFPVLLRVGRIHK